MARLHLTEVGFKKFDLECAIQLCKHAALHDEHASLYNLVCMVVS